MIGDYTRIPCAHDGCKMFVLRRAPTGLCCAHYNAKRRESMHFCSDCGKPLFKRARRKNFDICQPCRIIRNAKTCTECGAKYSNTRARKSGRCDPCQRRAPTIREQIGEEKLPDYYTLTKRGVKRDEAIAFINSGQPVVRKFGTPNAKITTMQAVQMVGDALAISPREILSESRFSLAVDCRAVVVAVMHRQGVSDCAIGRRMNRDHTSILHLRRTFEKRTEKRPVLGRLVERILEAA